MIFARDKATGWRRTEIEIRVEHSPSQVSIFDVRRFHWCTANKRLNLSWTRTPISFIVGSFESWFNEQAFGNFYQLLRVGCLRNFQLQIFATNWFCILPIFSTYSSPLNPDVFIKTVSPYSSASALLKYVPILRAGLFETFQIRFFKLDAFYMKWFLWCFMFHIGCYVIPWQIICNSPYFRHVIY